MPEALELGYRSWDLQKRKSSKAQQEAAAPIGFADSIPNRNKSSSMPNDEWESSSTNRKRVRPQSDWKSSGSEEVGDTDDIHMQSEMPQQNNNLIGAAAAAAPMGIQGTNERKKKMIFKAARKKSLENTVGGAEKNAAQETRDKDCEEKKRKKDPVTMDDTRECMQSIIMELKKAREDMLSWLRQEMQSIMLEASAKNARKRECKVKVEYEEKQASDDGHDDVGEQAVVMGGHGSPAMDFGTQESGNGDAQFFAGQDTQNNNSPPADGQDGIDYQNGGGGGGGGEASDSRRRSEEDVKVETTTNDAGSQIKYAGGKMEMGFQVKSEIPVGFGVQSRDEGNEDVLDFGSQNRDQDNGDGGLSFGLQNRGGLNNGGSVQVLSFDRHNITEDDFINFRGQNEASSEIAFGNNGSGAGAVAFGSQSRDAALIFGSQNMENGCGYSAGSRNPSFLGSRPTAQSGSRKGSSMHISEEDRTHDLIGMQQNPVTLSMMWNHTNSSHSNNNSNRAMNFNDFNYEIHAKTGNGATAAGPYRGLIPSSTPYDNSLGMINSAVMQVPNHSMGSHIPTTSLQGASASGNRLGTSSLTSFMGLQNQVSVQNFSGMQNFLGLSMNGGSLNALPQEGVGGRHGFPGLYLNECRQHATVNAKMNNNSVHAPATAIQSRSRKRGSPLHSVDALELN